ncbi:unnamed protein product [Spodoptera littoralis]|uniref:Uncharacterized protein n=2 Tax=Spodoptera TaxID=7106 RepID=A0A9P0IBZ1_SPOLI|nr:UPF0488 protein CG14286 [Spodoptera litura]CAB3512515.1 unnamed protein product [Spodoptera littoralis]CAH1642464.1 unnamed protein product [Spodoptera littoralis]
MPKPTKLHSKGKSNSLQKPCKVEKDTSDGVDPEESVRQFQLELCWCIQQLERSLNEKKGNEKQMQEAWKVLTVLKNNNQPTIRKRQLMRTHFGDYRAKMAAEEKKLAKMASKIKISDVPDKPKATFLRKSAFLTTGNESFRFNFNLAPDQLDNDKIAADNGNTSGCKTDSDTKVEPDVATTKKVSEDSAKKFKFSFTKSEFKFNFNVDNS